jgi:hypothetical protein
MKVRIREIAVGIPVIVSIRCLLDPTGLADCLVGGVIGWFIFWIVRRYTKGRLGSGDIIPLS